MIDGKYDDATQDILKAIGSDSDVAGDSDTDEEDLEQTGTDAIEQT